LYAVTSQIKFHGYDPEKSLIQISPRENEHTLRTDDILQLIETHANETTLLLLSGVQYYTGQFFEIEKITKFAHEKGIIVGLDLAHAMGNIPLKLHDWEVDFACWCSYKYLNSGPGAIAGIFVHPRNESKEPRFAGWWGHDLKTRFDMSSPFSPIEGAYGYRLSNPCVLSMTALRSSLDVFDEAGIENLRKKSELLTGYLEALLLHYVAEHINIITPADPNQRGCQLSIIFRNGNIKHIHDELNQKGVIVDTREPDVMRVAPTPLYNTFTDVRNFVSLLLEVLVKK